MTGLADKLLLDVGGTFIKCSDGRSVPVDSQGPASGITASLRAAVGNTGAVRHIAFGTDDVDGVIEKVKAAGYEVFIEPNDIVIRSDPPFPARMAFCYGPLGEELEFFQEK